MAAGASSRVKLLIEIAETGGEKLDKLIEQFAALAKPIQVGDMSKSLNAQTVATEKLTNAKRSNAKATQQQVQANKQLDMSAQSRSLSTYTTLSKEDLRIQNARLKQALLQKREAKTLAEQLEKQKRAAAEQAAALKAAEAAQKEATKAAARAVADQQKLEAAMAKANQKIFDQSVALQQLKQASAQKLSEALAAADARAQKEAAKATAAREKAEQKLSAALTAQQAAQDALKQKQQQAIQAEKEHAKQMQAVVKEALKKKRALAELARQLEEQKRKLHELKNPTNSFVDGLENAASTAALLQGPLGGVASRIGTLATLLKDVNPRMAAAVLGIGTLATGFGAAIIKAGQVEAQLLKLNAIIKATGSAAGFTVGQVNQMAKALAAATVGDAAQARDAIAKLLTFKGIQDENFERTLVVLGDMAAVFGSLDEASVQLGKALEDPIQGLGSLREIGVSVTQQQQDMIKELQKSGNLWLAQQEVLAILEGQIGGAGAAQGAGLVGAFERLTESVSSLFTTIGEGRPLKAATFLMNQLADAIQRVEGIIAGSTIEKTMKDIADQSEVVRTKLGDIAKGKLDASAKAALEAQLAALQEQSNQMSKQQELLERRQSLHEEIKRTQQAITDGEKAGIKADQGRFKSLLKTYGSIITLGSQAEILSQATMVVKGDQAAKLKEQKEELEGLNKQLVAYDQAVKDATAADKEAQQATQRAQGLEQQKQTLEELNKERKKLDREFVQQQIRTLQTQTDAQVAAEEERFRRGEQGLKQYLDKRTELETKQADRQRSLLESEVVDLQANLKTRLDAIAETNKLIAAKGGLVISPDADQEAVRLSHALRIAQEDLARFQFETQEGLAKIAKTRREEEEKLGQEAKQNAREAERDARRAKTEAAALAEAQFNANLKRRKAILELRSLELDGADAIESRMQLAADAVAESFQDARHEIVKVLGEAQADVVDQLIDTKSVTAQFDALEDIYQERISRLGVIVTNLQTQRERGKINYQDFVQGAANAYADADKQLIQLINRLQQLADASGSSELKNRLLEIQTQFEATQAAGEQFTTSVVETLKLASRGVAEAGFQSFFDSLFEDITNLEDAFRSLGLTILSELQKIVSSRIAAEFGDMLGNLFSAGSSAGAASSGGGWWSTAASAVGSFFGGGFATGGYVRGPGSTKSDSIRAMLSDKEFVTNAQATQYYGVDFMHAINSRALDRKALRGLLGAGGMRGINVRVPSTPRFAEGGAVNVALQAPAGGGDQKPIIVQSPAVYNMIDSGQLLNSALSSSKGKKDLLQFIKYNGRDIMNLLPEQKKDR